MTFENFIKIVHGTFRHQPTIKAFEKVETDPNRIKNGDLFLGNSVNDVKKALKNGAYGIASERKLRVLDKEVAWIRVPSCENVLIKLLRLSLLNRDVIFYNFSTVEFDILKKVTTTKGIIIFLEHDYTKDFKKIINAKNSAIFISSNKDFTDKIYPSYQLFNPLNVHYQIKIIKASLFLTSFLYKDKCYKDIKLPKIFISKLESVVNFLEQKQLQYDINKLDFIEHFKPIFVNKNLKPKNFGTSQSTIILEKEIDLIEEELNFLLKRAKWSKIILFLPKGYKVKKIQYDKIIYYKELEEIQNLTKETFNFILILADYNELFEILNKINLERQLSLF